MTFNDKILVIADLHLQSAEPDTLALALAFFKQAQGARHLYIIGDLFEYWLGDDCLDSESCNDSQPRDVWSDEIQSNELGFGEHRSGEHGSGNLGFGKIGSSNLHQSDPDSLEETISCVVTALSSLSQSGTAITLMHGNRDFLLGDAFANEIGATLVRDDILALNKVVLMHGDTLCTDDVEYQQFRAQVRDADWQTDFLAKPVSEREAIATALRSGSKNASRQKSIAIMDVNDDAVDQVFSQFGCQQLIHGHTHRPAIHQHESGTRVVLGDWHADHAMVGIVKDGKIELLRFTTGL